MIRIRCPHCKGLFEPEPGDTVVSAEEAAFQAAQQAQRPMGLTRRQLECLAAIEALTARAGVSPNLNEIQVEIGSSSRGDVHRLLTCLRERGYVTWRRGSARSIVVLRRAEAAE